MRTKLFTLITLATLLFSFTSCSDKDEDKTITVTLGAQENTSVNGFYAVGENRTYNMADAAKDSLLTDIFCFYEESTGNNIALASPGSGITGIFTGDNAPSNWKHQNLTKFFQTTLTVEQFDAVQDDDALLVSSFDAVNARKKAKDLQVGQVWAFCTQDYYYGLLKVTAVTEGTNGTATFEVKKMKQEPGK